MTAIAIILGSTRLATEFVDGYTHFEPSASSEASLDLLLDQVVRWAAALAPLRSLAS